MMNKAMRIIAATTVLMVVLPVVGSAVTLLQKDAALKGMFPGADEVLEETKTLSDAQLSAVKDSLGGQLVHYQEGSEAQAMAEKRDYVFYVAMKGGERTGVALIEEQPGKWGPVEFVVALDPETAKVQNLAVMSYKEKRGRPIARRNFLRQFVGKDADSKLKLREDVRGITGATISSDCACFAVKKVIALYKELYLNGN